MIGFLNAPPFTFFIGCLGVYSDEAVARERARSRKKHSVCFFELFYAGAGATRLICHDAARGSIPLAIANTGKENDNTGWRALSFYIDCAERARKKREGK